MLIGEILIDILLFVNYKQEYVHLLAFFLETAGNYKKNLRNFVAQKHGIDHSLT